LSNFSLREILSGLQSRRKVDTNIAPFFSPSLRVKTEGMYMM